MFDNLVHIKLKSRAPTAQRHVKNNTPNNKRHEPK